MHGNNVVWLCAKYAVDANLLQPRVLNPNESEATYKTEQRRGGIYRGGTFRGGVYLEPFGLIVQGSYSFNFLDAFSRQTVSS